MVLIFRYLPASTAFSDFICFSLELLKPHSFFESLASHTRTMSTNVQCIIRIDPIQMEGNVSKQGNLGKPAKMCVFIVIESEPEKKIGFIMGKMCNICGASQAI